MDKLSVVIITFNEERNIRRCIESVIKVADEIVVVDSYSTDSTREICSEFNIEFIEQEFLGYIEQKNYALSFAKYDYVLSLDADEALSEELIDNILYIKSGFESDGYTMNRLTNYCGTWIKHGGWYPDRKLRLFNHRLGNWGGVNPHDEFIFSDQVKISHIKGNILHYSYYTINDHHKQIDHFTTISANQLYEKGKYPGTLKKYLSPFVRFIKDYILNFGFLDGKAGLQISILSARASYIKYIKLRDLYNKNA